MKQRENFNTHIVTEIKANSINVKNVIFLVVVVAGTATFLLLMISLRYVNQNFKQFYKATSTKKERNKTLLPDKSR